MPKQHKQVGRWLSSVRLYASETVSGTKMGKSFFSIIETLSTKIETSLPDYRLWSDD